MADRFLGGVRQDQTDVTIAAFFRSLTDNSELTGLLATDINASYWRQGGSRVAITVSDLTAVDDPHSDGGFFETDTTNMPGLYRFDVPDAAFAAGADWVVVTITATGAFVYVERFNITKEVPSVAEIEASAVAKDLTVQNVNGNILRKKLMLIDRWDGGQTVTVAYSGTVGTGASIILNCNVIGPGDVDGQSSVNTVLGYIDDTQVFNQDVGWVGQVRGDSLWIEMPPGTGGITEGILSITVTTRIGVMTYNIYLPIATPGTQQEFHVGSDGNLYAEAGGTQTGINPYFNGRANLVSIDGKLTNNNSAGLHLKQLTVIQDAAGADAVKFQNIATDSNGGVGLRIQSDDGNGVLVVSGPTANASALYVSNQGSGNAFRLRSADGHALDIQSGGAGDAIHVSAPEGIALLLQNEAGNTHSCLYINQLGDANAVRINAGGTHGDGVNISTIDGAGIFIDANGGAGTGVRINGNGGHGVQINGFNCGVRILGGDEPALRLMLADGNGTPAVLVEQTGVGAGIKVTSQLGSPDLDIQSIRNIAYELMTNKLVSLPSTDTALSSYSLDATLRSDLSFKVYSVRIDSDSIFNVRTPGDWFDNNANSYRLHGVFYRSAGGATTFWKTNLSAAYGDFLMLAQNWRNGEEVVWASETAFLRGQVVPGSGCYHICDTEGTTDVSEPVWSTSVGETTVDGTVTWLCITDANNTGDFAPGTFQLSLVQTGQTIPTIELSMPVRRSVTDFIVGKNGEPLEWIDETFTKTYSTATPLTGSVDANLVAIGGNPTNDNTAELHLRLFSVINETPGTTAFRIEDRASSEDGAVYIRSNDARAVEIHTLSGVRAALDIHQNGTGLDISAPNSDIGGILLANGAIGPDTLAQELEDYETLHQLIVGFYSPDTGIADVNIISGAFPGTLVFTGKTSMLDRNTAWNELDFGSLASDGTWTPGVNFDSSARGARVAVQGGAPTEDVVIEIVSGAGSKMNFLIPAGSTAPRYLKADGTTSAWGSTPKSDGGVAPQISTGASDSNLVSIDGNPVTDYSAVLRLRQLDIQSPDDVAFRARGGGANPGAQFEGGETGRGLELIGGPTSGDGMMIQAPTSGMGLRVLSTNGNPAVRFAGSGTGVGLAIHGGSTGDALLLQGGGISGRGAAIVTTDGHGVEVSSGGAGKVDILATKDVAITAITYNPDNTYNTITLADGRVITFTYAAGILQGVSYS